MKNQKNVERGKKAYETHLRKFKESILSSSESTSSSGDLSPSSTPLTTIATPTSTTAPTISTTATPSFTPFYFDPLGNRCNSRNYLCLLFLHQQKAGTGKTRTSASA